MACTLPPHSADDGSIVWAGLAATAPPVSQARNTKPFGSLFIRSISANPRAPVAAARVELLFTCHAFRAKGAHLHDRAAIALVGLPVSHCGE